jgi:DNA repair exonuclease SbcCD nuclease subunit
VKFAILGDTHLGARSASSHFSKHFNRFFAEVFYPYLIKNGIQEVIQLGDFFDDRTKLSVKAYNECKAAWLHPLATNGIHMHILVGNHDSLHKNSIKVNTPELILQQEFRNSVSIYSQPAVLDLSGTTISMIPWICDENREAVFEFFRSNRTDLCCGHFEIDGFDMQRGVPGHGGLPRDIFDKFEATFSGHYHTQSYDDLTRIRYVGTPYEITFADANDPRGFYAFDTETRSVEFIANPFTMFERVVYNEGWSGDTSSMAGKIVKLVVEKKSDLYQFDRFVDSLKLAGTYELQIIENFADIANAEIEGEVKLEDSRAIIENYIDGLTTAVDKRRLKEYVQGLYLEAIAK